MSFVAQTVLKPMSMASNGCFISSPSLFTTSKISSSYPSLSVPFKLINFQLSCKKISSHALPASFPLKKKETLLRFCVVAAQEENSPVILEEREEDEQGFGVSNDWEESEGAGEDGYVEPPEGAKVFVGNLPFDVDSERLAMVFQNAGVVEAAEVIYDRDTNQSRGFGFVTMSTEEEAQKAVEMFQSYDLGGRLLFANIATPKRSRTERSERPERVQRGSGASNKLYVGNLSWNVDSQRLEQVFSEHGKVVSARVVSDMESGRSRGFGFVEMLSESEMNDAIANLDGQSLDGRAIKVNTATERPRRSRF